MLVRWFFALTLMLLIMAAAPISQHAQSAPPAKAEEKTLNSQTDGVDVLARRRKELLISDEWASKHPTKIIPDSDRKDINEAIWKSREILLSYLAGFNSKSKEAAPSSSFPSHLHWPSSFPRQSRAPALGPAMGELAYAVLQIRNSFERAPTPEERAVLEAAEDNILQIVSDKKSFNYFEYVPVAGEQSPNNFWNAAHVLGMLVDPFSADGEAAAKKRWRKNATHIRSLVSVIEKLQIKDLGLWRVSGNGPLNFGAGGYDRPTAPYFIGTSTAIVRALRSAEKAGFKVSKTTLSGTLDFVVKQAVKFDYSAPLYFGDSVSAEGIPRNNDGEGAKKETPINAIGWHPGWVPIDLLDPKKLIPAETRAGYTLSAEEKAKSRNAISVGELAILILLSENPKSTKTASKARKLIPGALAHVVGVMNPDLAQGNPSDKPEPSQTLLSFANGSFGIGSGISLPVIAMLAGRERFGTRDLYFELIESALFQVRKSRDLGSHRELPKTEVFGEWVSYYIDTLLFHSTALENLYYQPIGKEGAAPESGKEGAKPVSGEAKPAPEKDSPDEPKQPGEKPSEDKATKKE